MDYDEYRKNATSPEEHDLHRDNKLAINDEQRENLMKRVMLLKMAQHNDQNDMNESAEPSLSESNDL